MASTTGDAVGTVADEDIQTVYLTPADRRLQDDWVWPPSAQSAPLLGALERCLDPIERRRVLREVLRAQALHVDGERKDDSTTCFRLPTSRRWSRRDLCATRGSGSR